MNLTTIAFKGMLFFQFVGCQLNAFMVKSHRSLMCGRLVLANTWEIFTLAKEQPYNGMSDKQVVENAIKGKNRKLLATLDMCLYNIMLKCWIHNTKQ